MRFAFARSFRKSLKDFPAREKVSIQNHVDSFMLAMDARQVPSGFGLKKLGENLWELRTDLAVRVLFEWTGDTLTFLFTGNHNEVRQFLRHYR